MANNITLNISEVTNNGVPCKDPIILVIGHEGEMAFPCTEKVDKNGNLKISLPDDVFTNKCVKIAVQCSECDKCGGEEMTICLCDTSADCPSCSKCVDGICVSLCKDDEICVDNTCCQCSDNVPCPQGFYCDGCKCRCNGKVNDRGECVECLAKSDCGPCQECVNGQCTDIVCPNNLICIGGECGCPPGSKYDIATNSCIPADECFKDSDCGTCETCVANSCQPIVCPKDHKCVDGECVYWPCVNTSCENGADCGPDCGCLDGECVPCYILECNGQCQDALGCKCNNLQKCEPVNNCGQYCDGNTPCLDQNCTCYNNECVSCENFPCDPDDCTGRYNCGCQDGDCTGGKGCNDKFELKKNTECSADGCELVATYNGTACNCDPIEFKVKNVYTPTIPNGGDIITAFNASTKLLELQVKLFKNNIPYEDFKNNALFGDDELVDATIKTTIVHRVDGTVVTPNVALVSPSSVDGTNKVGNIVISNNNVVKTFNGKGTSVSIEVRAENVKVNSNNCIQYKSKVIAIYELDFKNEQSTRTSLTKIVSTFTNEVSQKVADNTSTRKPLFVWSKSNTGVFGLNKYQNNGTYNQNGFFRKEYGINAGGVWTDKVNAPAKDNELWNNFNYRATVDCGCGGGNGATLQNVVFCCTENIDYTISNCGKTITVPPFSVCSVNKNLTNLNSTGYTIPQEAQTYFWVIINGNVERLLRVEGGEVINNPYTYTHETNINSVSFEQRYKGSAIVPTACTVEYTEDYDGPDYDVVSECRKIIVTKLPSSPVITSVTGKKGNQAITFTSTLGGTVWTSTSAILSIGGEFEVTVNFQNSCSFTKLVTVTCEPTITATPTSEYALGLCGKDSNNPDVIVEAVSGFSSAVQFSKDGITYVAADYTNPISKTFSNIPEGVHTFYAKEVINGVEVIKTAIVSIKPPFRPTLVKVDICGNTQGSITITGAAPASTWKLFGPAFSGFAVPIGSNGSSPVVQIPIDKPGQYIAKLDNDPTGGNCPNDISIDVVKAGGNITPTIVTDKILVCNDGEVFFRIDDGGLNLTYNVQLSTPTVGSGRIADLDGNTIATVQANNTGVYNAKVTGIVNNQLGNVIQQIVITGVASSTCYVMTPFQITKSYTVQPGPKIGTISVSCGICDRKCYSVLVSISGTTTGVTIDGQPAAPIAAGVWGITNVQSEGPIPIVATNSATGCSDTASVTELPNCDGRDNCPPQTISISANPDSPTCGVQTVSLFYVYSTLGDIDGAEYLWYKTTGGIMQLLASGTISGTTVPQQNVTSSFTNETYALVIRTINGICEYTSNELTVFAQNTLSPEIFGAGISPDTTTLVTGQTYSYNTGFIPGATYTWTLSNANGSNQPVGTNSNAIQISSFTDGANTINLTVTDGICTGTASVTLNVGLSCPDVVLSLVGTGNDGCRGIGVTVNNMPSGVTISSYAWYVNGVITSQTGSAPIVNFNSNVVEAADTADITIEVTFSNGCVVESADFEYTRCACICSSSNACGSSQLYSLDMGTSPGTVTTSIGEFDSGSEFEWYLGYNGTAPIKYVFKLDGVTIRDTGIITRMASAGGCTTGSCPVGIQYLGDDPVDTVVMNTGPTQLTGLTTATQVSGGCTRLINTPGVGFIQGTGANTITLGSAGFLTVEVTTYSDVSCGTLASQATLKLECV